MSHHKCQTKKNPNYEIKQRYIPTYVHEQIFEEAPLRPYSSRCTPTFHSTVFDTEGYNIKTVHSKNVNPPIQVPQPKKVVYCNKSQQKRVEDNCKAHKIWSPSKDHWFDHTKQEIFSSIPNGQNRGYSKERKYVDLSSDPVFTDFMYENKSSILRTAVQPIIQRCEKNQEVITKPGVKTLKNSEGQAPKQIVSAANVGLQNAPQVVLNEAQENTVIQQKDIDLKKTLKDEKEKQSKTVKIVQKSNSLKSNQQNLKVKGRNPLSRPQTAQKGRALQQKPTFTVFRKSCVHQL